MIKKGDILTLSDDKEYTVVDMFNQNEKIYVYLVDINDIVNVIYARLENDEIVEITDSAELEHIIHTVNENLHAA